MAAPAPAFIADLALENWRASGARTIVRLESLIQAYVRSYYGSDWPLPVIELAAEAERIAKSRVRAYEVQT